MVDYSNFTVRNESKNQQLPGKPIPEMLVDILRAEGIYPLMEQRGMLEPPNPETA